MRFIKQHYIQILIVHAIFLQYHLLDTYYKLSNEFSSRSYKQICILLLRYQTGANPIFVKYQTNIDTFIRYQTVIDIR